MPTNDVEIRVRVRNMVREGLLGATRDARLAGGQAGGAFGDQFTRDANGRLHDQRGRYISEGALAGRSYGLGFGGGLGETFGKAFKNIGAAVAPQLLGGLAASATSMVGALALLPAAALAGGAAFATLKIGMSGFSDALKSMDDPAKFAEALKKLSPEAAKTAQAIKKLSPEFKELKNAVQDGLFYGMAAEIKNVGSNLLPMLTDKLEATASNIGDMGRELTKFLSGGQAKNDLSTTLKNVYTMFGNMKPVLANLVSGFLSLGAAGSSFLPQFGTWLANITTKFAAWAKSANDTGKAQTWIKDALAEFKKLGQILGDLGSIAKTLFEAMGDSDVLTTIHGITGGIAEWLAQNKELLPIIISIFVAFKAYSAIRGILMGVAGAMKLLGASATTAAGGVGGVAGKLGLIKGLAAAGGIAILADQLDKANVAAAGGAENLTGWNEQLHDFVEMGKTIAAGDFDSMFKGISDQFNDAVRQFQSGQSFAGKGNLSATEILGFNSVRMGDEFKKALEGMNKTWLAYRTAFAPVSVRFEGDITPVKNGVANVVNFANGQTGTVTVGANGQPAQVTVDGVKYNVDSTTGIMTLAANQDPALGTLNGTKATIDTTTGRLILDANDAPARAKIANLISTASQTVYLNVSAFASSLPTFKSAVGGGAHGLTMVGERGPELVRAMAGGGAAGGGMRLVGERGPELLNLGAGSAVLPYSNTQQMLRNAQGGGGGGGGAVQVSFSGGTDSALATVIMRLVRTGQIQFRAV